MFSAFISTAFDVSKSKTPRALASSSLRVSIAAALALEAPVGVAPRALGAPAAACGMAAKALEGVIPEAITPGVSLAAATDKLVAVVYGSRPAATPAAFKLTFCCGVSDSTPLHQTH